MFRMKLKRKFLTVTTALTSITGKAVAHAGEETSTTGGAMMDGSLMHTGADVMGYNMWGMGWYGALFGLAFWTLVVLAIIYLFQQITHEEGEKQ
jgi:hypothetical protein